MTLQSTLVTIIPPPSLPRKTPAEQPTNCFTGGVKSSRLLHLSAPVLGHVHGHAQVHCRGFKLSSKRRPIGVDLIQNE